MQEESIYEHMTRLVRLLQAGEHASELGLQPVQIHALHYLDQCNRYSDRPAVVAEYLGITKGTASQTLKVLEAAGLIAKRVDPDDRRVVHLRLTPVGKRALRAAGSRRLLTEALETLPKPARVQLEDSLAGLLKAMQRVNGGRSFGVCRTCRHFKVEGGGKYRCGLTSEPLQRQEGELICREHEQGNR